MNGWTLAAAAVLSGLTIGVAQEPARVAVAEAMVAPSKQDQRVSVSFNRASVAEVLAWLSKSGVSYVASDTSLPKDATITLNIQNRPVEEVADAIAAALGGHWERRGGTRVFRSGEGFRFVGPEGFRRSEEFAPKLRGLEEAERAKVFRLTPQARDKMRMEIEQHLKDMPKMSEEALRSLREFKGPDGERMRIEITKDVEEAMKDARKALEEARKANPEAFKERTWVMPDREHMRALEMLRVLPKAGEPGRVRVFGDGREPLMVTPRAFNSQMDLEKLMKSLTRSQREKHERQGYLTYRDLDAAQRKMLGLDNREGQWTVKFVKDKESITIKSE